MGWLGCSIPALAAGGEREPQRPQPQRLGHPAPQPLPHLLPCLPPPSRKTGPFIPHTKQQCANFPEAPAPPHCLLLIVTSSPHPSSPLSRPPQSLLHSEKNVLKELIKQRGVGGLSQSQGLAAATLPALPRKCGPRPCKLAARLRPRPSPCCRSPRPGCTQTPLPLPGPRRVQKPAFQSWLGPRLQSHRMAETALGAGLVFPTCHPGAQTTSAPAATGTGPLPLHRTSFLSKQPDTGTLPWEPGDTDFGPQTGHLLNGWPWRRHVFIPQPLPALFAGMTSPPPHGRAARPHVITDVSWKSPNPRSFL